LNQRGLAERIVATLCAAGDAVAALGADTFWHSAGLGGLPLTHVPAYCNPVTFGQRVHGLLSSDARDLTGDLQRRPAAGAATPTG